MADVRSLLKNERATRRIDHPQAFYTATGTLECSVCKSPIKSDIEAWNKHLKSPQHAMRAERLRVGTKQPSILPAQNVAAAISVKPSNGGKKRKAHDDGDEEDARKRTRPEDIDSSKLTRRKVSSEEPSETDPKPPIRPVDVPHPSPTQVTVPPPPPASKESVNEDEWAAFEATLARPSSPSPPPNTTAMTVLTAGATVSAAPVTAAQLAAQSSEEASLQNKERREAEVEGEKEDAARQLEEEFAEMEELEERVRRLRQQREKLRLKSLEGAEQGKSVDSERKEAIEETATDVTATVVEMEESEDDEYFDMWGGWGRR